jgi:hypothetical protein
LARRVRNDTTWDGNVEAIGRLRRLGIRADAIDDLARAGLPATDVEATVLSIADLLPGCVGRRPRSLLSVGGIQRGAVACPAGTGGGAQDGARTKTTKRLTARYRRDIAAPKRQIAPLQKTVAFLQAQEKRRVAAQPAPAKPAEGARFRLACYEGGHRVRRADGEPRD